ncbi:MAG: NAD-dependent epimerase/dehydratase family protein [Bacteroidales bacterium]|nr:NAD-dependent epimerase/dehydratase family protein [Bacteroidales bacterium]
MQKKILVTGGLGFIGHHLTKQLLKQDSDCRLSIVDNLSSTKIDFSWLPEQVEVHIMDLLDFNPTEPYDEIYHLASPVGALGILKRNGYIARDILSLSYKIAELSIQHNARLLFVSSSEIYGHDGVHTENVSKVVPNYRGTRLEYSLGKLLSEEILYNLSIDHRLNFSVCRPFNVFGEQQSAELGFVIPAFFQHALHQRPLPVFMDGKQKRSFCYVQDIVDAMLLVMERGAKSGTYNIGHDGNCVSILELAGKILEVTGSRSGIAFVDPIEIYGEKYAEAFDKIPDLTKMKEELGWVPKVSLEDALKQLVVFYHKQENPDNAD